MDTVPPRQSRWHSCGSMFASQQLCGSSSRPLRRLETPEQPLFGRCGARCRQWHWERTAQHSDARARSLRVLPAAASATAPGSVPAISRTGAGQTWVRSLLRSTWRHTIAPLCAPLYNAAFDHARDFQSSCCAPFELKSTLLCFETSAPVHVGSAASVTHASGGLQLEASPAARVPLSAHLSALGNRSTSSTIARRGFAMRGCQTRCRWT